MKTLALLLILAVTASAKDIIISPGDSLEKARDEARAGDRIVLRGGTYTLKETLVLGTQNSGVTWMAAPGETPVVSGGIVVSDWVLDVKGRFKAAVKLDNFRQLWVNGRRAERAKGALPAGLEPWGKLETSVKRVSNPPGTTVTPGYEPGTLDNFAPAGYTTTDAGLADWKNPGDIEFDYLNSWSHKIAKIEKITGTAGGAIIEMSQPGFYLCRRNAGILAGELPGTPSYIENALELLTQPGQWYFDRPAHTLYYLPRPGEDMSKAEVIAPKLETLIEMKDAHDMSFKGLTFAYATWLRPSTSFGHPDLQANFIDHPDDGFFIQRQVPRWYSVGAEFAKSPANLVVDRCRGVRFDECTFRALGGAGLDLQDGAQANIVSGCIFEDISGNGIQVGDVTREDHHPSDPGRILKDNQIIDNVITRVGAQYTDSVGVFVGYTQGTVIAHNEIFQIPYSGISCGWGWGMTDAGGGAYPGPKWNTPTPAKDNRIEFNHIHDLMRERSDGGAVYMLGRQPGTVVSGNWIHDAGPGHPGGLYLDEGSSEIEMTGNLVQKVPQAIFLNNWAQHRDASCSIHNNDTGMAAPVTTIGVNGQRALKAGSFIDVPDEPRLNAVQFTLTAWVRLDKYPGGNDPRRWIACQERSEWNDHNISLIVDGKFAGGYINIGGGQQNCFAVSGTSNPLPLNQWTQVALTYDGDTLRVYCDGKEAGAKQVGKVRAAGAAPWTFGARSDRFSTFDCGDIANVRLYNRPLTSHELHGDEHSAPSGLVQAWDFGKLSVRAGTEAGKIMAEAGLEPDFRHLLDEAK